ncbi:MAG TPA: hypothetical protein VFQ44_07940 [Streptosporangiaceae bacterium]|nr:hypothetical protein [Streptosporangiaceae bacterium]
MADAPAAPRWRVLFTPRWLSWHLFAIAAFTGMLWLGDWQFRRAIGGNPLSWAYTFEWPVFAIFGVVFWVKTVRDELRPAGGREAAGGGAAERGTVGRGAAGARTGQDEAASLAQRQLARTGSGAPGTGVSGAGGDDDDLTEDEAAELAEYNAYLARLANAAPKPHRSR